MSERRRQLRTLDYSQDARDRLAEAVTEARLAAGFKWRTQLAKVAGISIRSLGALELGEPGVGQATLFSVARVLPGWTVDTPRKILEGGNAPEPAPPPTRAPRTPNEERALLLTKLRLAAVEALHPDVHEMLEQRRKLLERALEAIPDDRLGDILTDE